MKLDLTTILAIAGTIGTIIFVINLAPAFMHAYLGNVANATDIAVRVSVEEIISSVYWAIILTFIGSIIAIFGIKLRT